MRWTEVAGQTCSIARSAALLGDRWTLLLIREVFLGTRRFDELRALTGASPQTVAARLARLVDAGVLCKVAYQHRPTRYEYRLTDMGRDLMPVMVSLLGWGDRWLGDGQGPPNLLRHEGCGGLSHPALVCDCCGEAIGPDSLTHEPSLRMRQEREDMLAQAGVTAPAGAQAGSPAA